MNTGLSADDPTVVAAFHRALLHEGLVVLLILAAATIAWNLTRSWQLRRVAEESRQATFDPWSAPEPSARRALRVAFGVIWVFDGILQGQAAMPLGLVPQGIQPTAAASPAWVQHVVNAGTTVWDYHPVAAAAAAVWIQVGIGVWLLAAPRGGWSRLGGAASVAWGLVVWVFGEAFGGIFAPGLTWLSGAPGAVLFYCAAGALIALPLRSWATPRLGRVVLGAMGLFLVGMAVLQAWPGRGFWNGRTTGTLSGMVAGMAQTSQPRWLSSWVAAFGGFDAAHGWAVNLFAVTSLALIGAAFFSGRPRAVRAAAVVAAVVCLADWVLVQDLGFLGGVGTDPNSMIPMTVLFVAGYLAVVRPAPADTTVVPITAACRSWRQRFGANPAFALRSVAAIAAAGITLVGVVPMSLAAADPHAGAILTEAVDGAPEAIDKPAPAFSLVDQDGRAVSLASLRGKAVAITFLDDVCTSVCPIIAQEFRAADGILGSEARHVELVAVNANPRFLAPDYLAAFDRQEGLDRVANWRYLTGSLPQLERAWRAYGITVTYLPGGAMIGHSLYAYVIAPDGRLRYLLDTDPGPASAATQSSFSATLADALSKVVAGS